MILKIVNFFFITIIVGLMDTPPPALSLPAKTLLTVAWGLFDEGRHADGLHLIATRMATPQAEDEKYQAAFIVSAAKMQIALGDWEAAQSSVCNALEAPGKKARDLILLLLYVGEKQANLTPFFTNAERLLTLEQIDPKDQDLVKALRTIVELSLDKHDTADPTSSEVSKAFGHYFIRCGTASFPGDEGNTLRCMAIRAAQAWLAKHPGDAAIMECLDVLHHPDLRRGEDVLPVATDQIINPFARPNIIRSLSAIPESDRGYELAQSLLTIVPFLDSNEPIPVNDQQHLALETIFANPQCRHIQGRIFWCRPPAETGEAKAEIGSIPEIAGNKERCLANPSPALLHALVAAKHPDAAFALRNLHKQHSSIGTAPAQLLEKESAGLRIDPAKLYACINILTGLGYGGAAAGIWEINQSNTTGAELLPQAIGRIANNDPTNAIPVLMAVREDDQDFRKARDLMAIIPLVTAETPTPVTDEQREALEWVFTDPQCRPIAEKIGWIQPQGDAPAETERAGNKAKLNRLSPEMLDTLVAAGNYDRAASLLKHEAIDKPSDCTPFAHLLRRIMMMHPSQSKRYPRDRASVEGAVHQATKQGYGAFAQKVLAKWEQDIKSTETPLQAARRSTQQGLHAAALELYAKTPAESLRPSDHLGIEIMKMNAAGNASGVPAINEHDLQQLQTRAIKAGPPACRLAAELTERWLVTHDHPKPLTLINTAIGYAGAGLHDRACRWGSTIIGEGLHTIPPQLCQLETMLEEATSKKQLSAGHLAGYYAKGALELDTKFQQSYYDKAKVYFSAHLKDCPHDTQALTVFAEMAMHHLDHATAGQAAEDLLKVAPSNSFAHFVNASVATHKGDFYTAIDELNAALRPGLYTPAMDLFRILALHGVGTTAYTEAVKKLATAARYDVPLPETLGDLNKIAPGAKVEMEKELEEMVGKYRRSGFFARAFAVEPVNMTAALVTSRAPAWARIGGDG